MADGSRPAGRGADVVIVGGGHNGLVAAAYLARAGLRTVVCERRPIVGGACTTEEFAPGFRASPGAYVLSLLRPAIWRDFSLRKRGLEVLEAAPTLNVFRDGARLTLHEDPAATARELARFDPADGGAFAAFSEQMVAVAGLLGPWFDRPPPGAPGWIGRGGLRTLARGAPAARRHGLAAARLFATSASDYLGERFRSEHVRAALGWDSISNTLAGPSTPGTAYALLHEHAAAALGGQTWGFVRGGMGVVTALLADAAREAGAVIRLDAEVEAIEVEAGRAVGRSPRLRRGDRRRHRDLERRPEANPARARRRRRRSTRETLAAIRAYRCQGASMKINLAVGELPRIEGTPAGLQRHHSGLIQLTAAALGDGPRPGRRARRGRRRGARTSSSAYPSVLDPSLAPPGRHVLTLGVRSQPYELAGTTWDSERERIADRIIDELATMIPNLPGSVIARQVLTPLDLERILALTGGHHLHGDMSPDQLGPLRPAPGLGGYRTTIAGLYLCGAGTHPGGGVTGANGRNCAARVLADRRRRGARGFGPRPG